MERRSARRRAVNAFPEDPLSAERGEAICRPIGRRGKKLNLKEEEGVRSREEEEKSGEEEGRGRRVEGGLKVAGRAAN